jgi:hypothetical protein
MLSKSIENAYNKHVAEGGDVTTFNARRFANAGKLKMAPGHSLDEFERLRREGGPSAARIEPTSAGWVVVTTPEP